MFRLVILIILTLVASRAQANWVCQEESIFRIDNIITSCGIGEDTSESVARKEADRDAYQLFSTFCKNSSDCNKQKIIVYPKRNECVTVPNGFKCYRAIGFHSISLTKEE